MADAQSALVDTGPISDFVSTHHDDPNFGSAWVTYDGGYRLHVRSTTADASFASIVDGLVKRVHAPVVRTFGGASRKELESKAQQLGASGVPNAINDEVGLIDVHDPQILVRDTSPLLTARTPAPSIYPPLAHAGSDLWWWNGGPNWQDVCTAGATWGGFGITGSLTAAHCPTPGTSTPLWTDGEYTANHGPNPLVQRTCGTAGDYMFVRFDIIYNEDESFFWKFSSPYALNQYHIAGGLYIGQPVDKIGSTNNPASSPGAGTNAGTVTAYDYEPYGAPCSATSRLTIRTNNAAYGGDSGGPDYLYYDNGTGTTPYYFGGITTNGDATVTQIDPVWAMSLPNFSSIHYCYIDNICN